MSLHIERKVPSELGGLELTVTSLEHICVRGKPEVRGIAYDAILHFFLINGQWGRKADVTHSIHRAYKQGEDQKANKRFHESASDAVKAKVEAVYLAEVVKFVADNMTVMVEAEDGRLGREIEAEEAKVREMRNDLKAKEAAIEGLRKQRLALLRNSVAK